MHKIYRIYADGRDFGEDFTDLESAREVKRRFAAAFPRVRYYIRRVA